MTDQEFKAVLNYFDLSWKGYRKVRKGVKRRLVRFMDAAGCRSVGSLLDLCDEDPQVRENCRIVLTVSVSRFFRDRKLWSVLETRLLPDMLSWCGRVFRVWSAGCARGEEAYSLAILWDELRGRLGAMPQLELWATDIHPHMLAEARKGVYQRSSLKEVSESRIRRYFQKTGANEFMLREDVKRTILWRQADLLSDLPPATGFHLLFLRNNLLTYYRGDQQKRAFERIWDAVQVGGFLVTGSRESLPQGQWAAVRSVLHPHLYRKYAA